jgi:probable phosphoglycerate mutase
MRQMMTEARLVLIRHGETHWNREGRIQGYHADSSLTEIGHAQANAVAERLAREGIDALHSSDAGRTRQTVDPISATTGLPIVYDSSLRERNYGIFEGRTFAEIELEYPDDFRKYRDRDPTHATPGGESAERFRDRVVAALEAIAARHQDARVAVVTHGGVLGMLYRHTMNIPLDAPRSYVLANASLNHFRFAGGQWLLDAWADVAHLNA